MTAVVDRDRMALGMGTRLDPATIDITRHAVERYLVRRGRGIGPENWPHADAKLRELLWRASPELAPVKCRTAGAPSRRYRAGGFYLIVSADHSALVTVYPIKAMAKGKARKAPRRPS